MGKRSASSKFVGSTTYNPNTVYTAPFFSRCTVTVCHPGLYIAGNGWDTGENPIWVAFWLDELVIAEKHTDKARVPLFRVVANKKDFKRIRWADMQPKEETDV